ncbi:hypothetical protein EHW67_01395 [Arenibacter aquaticus]|uniref:Uncharacterized protein n=1 Tax=Arenibacter aquaticus TaxID=2489054 RepID=A0A430K851_9FLAO|nr:hypothetical protein EHW67_01395 [Arenibacter aquaticus]
MRLFAKIRRSLIVSGKFKSYLLYAFGEIFLIVIGILIAWKINDLNEIRKNRIVEAKIYHSLYEELNTNLNVLNTGIDKYASNVKRLEATLNYVGLAPEQITPGAKDTIVHINYSPMVLLDGALNSIISTSKFEIIESDSLKNLIANYPTNIEEFKITDAKINEIVVNHLQPEVEKHLALVDMLPRDNPKYNNLRDFGKMSNYYSLLNSKEYQNAIVDRLLQTENLLTQAKKLKNRTQIMALQLKKELGYTVDN